MKLFSGKRILAIAKKEFFHIIHDPRSLIIVLILPVLQLIMFGYALNTEIKNINLGFVDEDHSYASQKLFEGFNGSTLYTLKYVNNDQEAFHKAFLRQDLKAVLIIPKGFYKDFKQNLPTHLQIIIDGSDPNTSAYVNEYIKITIQKALLKHLASPDQTLSGIDLRSQMLYNPGLRSSYFFVPGLIALILIMISAMLTSITITREKETGTLEQLLVSPIHPLEFIIGKLLPYIFISFFIGLLILVLGIVMFKVVFIGNAIIFAVMSLIYIITALSLGLFISAISDTQMMAMMLAMMITMLPTVMLSGFIFPISSMPKLLQWFSYLIPARYFLRITRGIMIKGNSFLELIEPTSILILISIILIAFAWKKFDKQVKELG